VGSLIDRAKVTRVEENSWSEKDGLSKQTSQTFKQPTSDTATDDERKWQQHIGGGVRTNKEMDQSWINKIKKVIEVENWRSWQ
jgi:hypothetical protein